MQTRSLVTCLLFACLFAVPSQEMPDDLFRRMVKTYSECESYRDSGVVTTIYHQKRGDREYERTERLPFTTAFARPDRFRYEFLSRRGEEEFDRYLVWRRGDDVRSWWDKRPGVETSPSLGNALAGPTGVSDGSANTIPTLLLPEEVKGNSLAWMKDLVRLEDKGIGTAKCYRIIGNLGSDRLTLWIDQKSSLLRRVEETSQFPDFWTESTIDYEPAVNVAIPESALLFDPPQ